MNEPTPNLDPMAGLAKGIADYVSSTVLKGLDPQRIREEIEAIKKDVENRLVAYYNDFRQQNELRISQMTKANDSAREALFSTIRRFTATTDGFEKTLAALEKRLASTADPVVLKVDPGNGKPKVNLGITHRQFPELLTMIGRGLNVYLIGPAGSGKTHVAEGLGKALGRPVFMQSLCEDTTPSELRGYTTVDGRYVPAPLYNAMEKGGLLFYDEFDATNSNAQLVVNTALANRYFAFPHKHVRAAEGFAVVATGNTVGAGADRLYVGRNQIDEAALNRFVPYEWQYDEALERKLFGRTPWTKWCHDARGVIMGRSLRITVSMRTIQAGNVLSEMGWSYERIADSLVFFKTADATKLDVLRDVPLPIAKKGPQNDPPVIDEPEPRLNDEPVTVDDPSF